MAIEAIRTCRCFPSTRRYGWDASCQDLKAVGENDTVLKLTHDEDY